MIQKRVSGVKISRKDIEKNVRLLYLSLLKFQGIEVKLLFLPYISHISNPATNVMGGGELDGQNITDFPQNDG